MGQVVVLEGPDTTLRTHAAQALATKLGKSVYRVRLTELTSGPATRRRQATEQACLQADASKSLLLIEEADALFATKTGASPRAARELTELLSRLRANSSASILSASHIRKIDPSILDAVRAVLRLAGTCTS
ncbi:MAG: AAA family ATPase [Nitrospiraceae bacterium]